MSKPLSGHFRGTSGAARSGFGGLFGIQPDESTASVWKHIKPTQQDYPGTKIPRSFVVDTPHGSFWTHGNATEHMNEAIISVKDAPLLKGTNPNLFAQFILYDYRKSLIAATRSGVKLNSIVRSGHWEFKFSKKANDKHPVVVHALFKGLE